MIDFDAAAAVRRRPETSPARSTAGSTPTWHPPGIVYLDVGCAKTGTGAPQR